MDKKKKPNLEQVTIVKKEIEERGEEYVAAAEIKFYNHLQEHPVVAQTEIVCDKSKKQTEQKLQETIDKIVSVSRPKDFIAIRKKRKMRTLP